MSRYLSISSAIPASEDEEENIPFVWREAAHSSRAGEGVRWMSVLAGEGRGADRGVDVWEG